MRIVILSGGSGNDSLLRGLIRVYPQAHINIIVNAYDNGKSTGVCRAVTNTLGVSDIRKNHFRLYQELIPIQHQDAGIVKFYKSRLDLTAGKELSEVEAFLDSCGLSHLFYYATRFFSRPLSVGFEYKDFSISNIIYAEMYAEMGYEATNKYFSEQVLCIPDSVCLNSFDNVYISANTKAGAVIHGEEAIVEYCNQYDPIKSIIYEGNVESPTLNPAAIYLIREADLIIISTGTFWASILPTFEYGGFYEYFNLARGKKIWVMNNEEDKDCYGVTSSNLASYMKNIGVNMDAVTILQNKAACSGLKSIKSMYDVATVDMGNEGGKHNPILLAHEIYKLYYGLDKSFEKYIFDFDDTIWSRDDRYKNISTYNVELVRTLGPRAAILSGNTRESIESHIDNIENFDVMISCEANGLVCHKGKVLWEDPEDFDIPCTDRLEYIPTWLKKEYDIDVTGSVNSVGTCYKLKPINSQQLRKIITDLLNLYYIGAFVSWDVEAKMTGRTTIDITLISNSKESMLKHICVDPQQCMYIGDEVDSGNDQEAAKACGHSVHVKDVYETNLILRLIVGA